VLWCFEDQAVGEVLQQMGDDKIRRLPVVNRDMQVVGMVSLGDIATRSSAQVEKTLENISQPSQPDRPPADDPKWMPSSPS
jgi:CBS-domain-containing membrane protein